MENFKAQFYILTWIWLEIKDILVNVFQNVSYLFKSHNQLTSKHHQTTIVLRLE